MSTAEIIEEIKKLPPEEVRRVGNYLNSCSSAEKHAAELDDAAFQEAADEVFQKYMASCENSFND